MKRFNKIFLVVLTAVILVFMLLGCDYKPKSKDVVMGNEEVISQEKILVEVEQGAFNTMIDNSVKLSADLSTNSNGVLTLTMNAEVYPERVSDAQLYWYLTEGDTEFDPTSFVPTSSIYRTDNFTFFTYLDKTESHTAKIQFSSCFTKTYTIWCISADNPYVYDTLLLRCEGAPKYITANLTKVNDGIDDIICDGSSSLYNFDYQSQIGSLGENYLNATPAIRLTSVISDYCLKYQYMYYADEYSTTPSVSIIYIPFTDIINTLMTCSLTPTETLVPVKNYVSFEVIECPEDLVGTYYLNDKYRNGKLTNFMGYTKASKVGTELNVPTSSNYTASDTGYISFIFEDSPLYGIEPFTINITIIEALNVSA